MAGATVRTETILDQLVVGKREELAESMAAEPLERIRGRAARRPAPQALAPALRGATVRLIAEIKQASPAAGMLAETGFDPVGRARSYAGGGAAAISILTEERRFLGSLAHISAVRDEFDAGARSKEGLSRPPLLRKDFLFDPYHLYEAKAAGADAVLLIVAILPQQALELLLALAGELGLSALVEVHEKREVERALTAGAEIIGINNRDLRTFETSLAVTERLRDSIPSGPVIVSESGIQSEADIERLAAAGVDAVLVGEALMRSANLVRRVRAFSSVSRQLSV